MPWKYFKTWVRWDRKWCLFWEDSLLYWRAGGKIIALSRLTEKGKRKPERKNMGIAANLIKMLVAFTYGLHYGIRVPVKTPSGLYLQILTDGGRSAVLLWLKDHEGNLQVDSGNPLVVLHQLLRPQFRALRQAWSISRWASVILTTHCTHKDTRQGYTIADVRQAGILSLFSFLISVFFLVRETEIRTCQWKLLARNKL